MTALFYHLLRLYYSKQYKRLTEQQKHKISGLYRVILACSLVVLLIYKIIELWN